MGLTSIGAYAIIFGRPRLEKYPRGRRGSPAKGVVRVERSMGSNPIFSAKKTPKFFGVFFYKLNMESYRSGHNGAVLKTVRRTATGVRIPYSPPKKELHCPKDNGALLTWAEAFPPHGSLNIPISGGRKLNTKNIRAMAHKMAITAHLGRRKREALLNRRFS